MVKQLKSVSYLLVATLLNSKVAWSNSISQEFKQNFMANVPQALVSLSLKPCHSKQTSFKYNSQLYLSPASVSKVFTAVSAIKVLGANYRFKTDLLKRNNDYYLRFSGDPSFRHQDLSEIIKQLKQKKVHTIAGNIYLDNHFYESPDYPESVSYEDLGWYYAAPVSSIIINRNALSYKVKSSRAGKMNFIAEDETLAKYFHLKQQLKLQTKKHLPCQSYIQPDTTTNSLLLYGCIKHRAQPFSQNFAILNPELLAKQLLKSILLQQGIKLKGKVIVGRTPKFAKVVVRHSSKPLTKLIQYMLQHSDNVYAGSFTKLLGKKGTGIGRFDTGAYVLNQSIAKLLKLPAKQFHFYDGAGNRFNLVTNAQVMALLNKIYQDKALFKTLIKTLPVSGGRGSLEERMNKKLKGAVFAKTGSMHDISSLAGFIHPYSKQCQMFSIITNNATVPLHQLKALEDQLVQSIEKGHR